MGENIPRRLKRFARNQPVPETQKGGTRKNASMDPGKAESMSSELSEQLDRPQNVELKYWDKQDPSLDELSSNLAEQWDTFQELQEEKKPRGKPDSPVDASKEDSQKTSSKPIESQSGHVSLEERRKERAERRSHESDSVASPSSKTGASQPEKSFKVSSSVGTEQSVRDLKVSDLFGEDADAAKKPSSDELEGLEKELQFEPEREALNAKAKKPSESNAGKSKNSAETKASEKEVHFENLNDLELDPELQKLKEDLKKKAGLK